MRSRKAARLSFLAAVFLTVAIASPVAATAATRLAAAVRLEDGVAGHVNLVRRRHGLPPLREAGGLAAAARRHSRDMALRGYFEHDSPSGGAFWRRIERTYGSGGFARWEVGENIAWNTARATPGAVVREWMRSPPHRANILSRAWRELGVGAYRVRGARGAYGGRAVTIVTLDLGVRVR